MENFLNDLAAYVEKIRSIKEIILTNIVLLGQTPCGADRNPHTGKSPRSGIFLERLSDGFADECTLDTFGNPYGIVKGSDSIRPPIVLVAHMDTVFDGKSELLYNVTGDAVVGPGLLDNSLGVGVLMSIPQVLKTLELSFQSDIVLIGLPESLHRCNLKSIHDVFGSWKAPIRAAICVEGGERGRLNYFSNSMVRVEVTVDIPKEIGWEYNNGMNAIIVMNEVINRILEIRLPQRPRTHIVLGCINSGTRFGKAPLSARLGFEVHSDSGRMVEEVFEKVEDICNNISHQTGVKIDLDRISAIKAAKLTSRHPLVQSAVQVMETLDIKPSFESSQSELSVFLSHNIPAITLGVAHGENYNKEDERAEIESIFKGIAQIIGVMVAVDQGVCDAR